MGSLVSRPLYAANTSVPSDRSRAEIERTLIRYGASSFGYGWEDGRAIIMFRASDRHVRFVLPIPDADDMQFQITKQGRARSKGSAEAAYEQAVRQRWRALALVIKAKLEAVETGIVDFESEFLAHLVLPNNETVGEWIRPQVEQAYETGAMPSLLPGGRLELTAGG